LGDHLDWPAVPGLVLEEHRPTLADLLRPRLARAPRWLRWALAAMLVVVVLLVLWRLLAGGSDGETQYVHRTPVVFNFHYPAPMHRVAARPPEIIRVERRRGSLFLDSFAVEPLSLPPFRGDVSGELPVYAEREIEALRKRFPQDFELTREGKARVNAVPGYDVQFRARLGERRLFGRIVLLPEPAAGEDLADPTGELENARSRRGVRLVMLATPASGAVRPRDVGARGNLKTPFRSFRFGTEGP
jgi:hypothetical protein